MTKIVVTGSNGRLGSELIREGCTPVYSRIDNVEQLNEELGYLNPDVLINCAAYTHVDACEDDEIMPIAVKANTRGVENLLRVPNRKFRLIHISTDYIFSGRYGPYDEKSKDFDPINNYGYSKLGGDILVRTDGLLNKCCDTVVRTTGLYGSHQEETNDFVSAELEHLEFQTTPFNAVKNLFGNQTYIPHLAEALLKLTTLENPPLILNLGSEEVVSRYDFAVMVASMFGYSPDRIVPIKSQEMLLWRAKRPVKGGLSVRLAHKLGLPIYTIKDGLNEYWKEK